MEFGSPLRGLIKAETSAARALAGRVHVFVNWVDHSLRQVARAGCCLGTWGGGGGGGGGAANFCACSSFNVKYQCPEEGAEKLEISAD